MSTKPPATTRASARSKPAATGTPAPAPTRTTRARTATATTTAKPATPEPTKTAIKRTVVRKTAIAPAGSVENLASSSSNRPQSRTAAGVTRKPTKINIEDADREPITAYLRIRPPLGDEEATSLPYLMPLSDTLVNMTNPQDPKDSKSSIRFSTVPPSSTYTFSHIFLPKTSQSDFFTKTTLPLVKDVLTGQNGLLFTYGVTNSGKTYTVQGGKEEGTAGILPRSLDVIFNSIEGLQVEGQYRPVRLHGIELADDIDSKPPPMIPDSSLTEVLGPLDGINETDGSMDPTVVQVDRNYEYSVWISYAEVYNEKVYDLLASVKGESYEPEASSRGSNGKPIVLTRKALTLRPSPAGDSPDSETRGKYIDGLRQFRVSSAAEAKSLVTLGQLHRRVFGTLANRESSRSHGMVMIKILRGHRGAKGDPASLQVSRLTLVDLAGSERTKHTHTTGDRLKEAGNINKSLMVLGQCMEVMRSNQRKLAASLSQVASKDNRIDTRDIKQNLAIVPFRHSKLTEALMDYFVGDGRTVMIINVNPYDTGYDENSHVMKFAALAKEVYVNPAPAPVQKLPYIPGKSQGAKIKQLGPLTLKGPEINPTPYTRRKVTVSIGGKGQRERQTEATLEVQEEDENVDDDKGQDEDDNPLDPFIESLFDEIQSLRYQLFDAEMRCATIETETREEVMQEMEERMRAVERLYAKRLMNELEQNDLKNDAKLDMLHQAGAFGSPIKRSRPPPPKEEDSDSEGEDVEASLLAYGSDDSEDESTTFSPLAKKGRFRNSPGTPRAIIQKIPYVPDPPMLPSDGEDAEMTETEADDQSVIASAVTGTTVDDEEDDEDDDEEENPEGYSSEEEDVEYRDGDSDEEGEEDEEDEEEDEEEDAWAPKSKTSRKAVISPSPSPSPPQPAARVSRVSALTKGIDKLNLEPEGTTKKKRQLGKNRVVTEDELNALTG